MKANRRFKRFDKDEEGVSTVLGAILMFGLFIVMLVKVQVVFVPVWDKQRESAHMASVSNQLAVINADLMRQVGNSTAVGASDPVTLDSKAGFSFFSSPSLAGSLAFTPSPPSGGFNLASNQLTIQNRNGATLLSFNEQWNAVPQGGTITNIAAIDHLRVRINAPGASTGSMMLRLTDSSGAYQAKIVITDSPTGGNGMNVETDVYGPTSETTPISTTFDFYALGGCGCPYNYHYLDALDAALQFTNVLQALNYPVTITTTFAGLTGDYAIVYDTPAPGGGTTRVGGQGIVVPNYSTTTAGGVLSFTKNNQRFPAQTYSIEYGAIILDQPEGSTMVVPPSFSVFNAATQTTLALSFPSLSGPSNSVTGTTQAIVNALPANGGLTMQALAPRLAMTLATTHGALWQTFWDDTLKAAGLTSASGQYGITTTATSATLTVYGPTVAPGSLTNDIFLIYGQSNVNVQIAASG